MRSEKEGRKARGFITRNCEVSSNRNRRKAAESHWRKFWTYSVLRLLHKEKRRGTRHNRRHDGRSRGRGSSERPHLCENLTKVRKPLLRLGDKSNFAGGGKGGGGEMRGTHCLETQRSHHPGQEINRGRPERGTWGSLTGESTPPLRNENR